MWQKPNLLYELMMNARGWDQWIQLQMLYPDNVAVTLSTACYLALTCNASHLSYCKVD